MGCHPRALVRIDQRIRDALTLGDTRTCRAADLVDQYLEHRYDAEHRATEWDASRWGFDPDRWCEAERIELAQQEPPATHGSSSRSPITT